MMTTITLYLYDARGVYTETREHSIKAPLPARWTKTPPPEIQDGEYAVWERNRWMVVTEEPPFPEPVIPVPQVVSRFQGRAAMHQEGVLDQVEEMIADPETPTLIKLAWADAQQFERPSPSIAYFAQRLGWTDQFVDHLFVVADGITA